MACDPGDCKSVEKHGVSVHRLYGEHLRIDKSIYEAAAIDGATKMKQIFYVTLPMLNRR